MLQLHHIDLQQKDKQYLIKNFQNGQTIKYKEALVPLQIDLAEASFDEKKWTVQRPDSEKKKDDDAMSRVTSKSLAKLAQETKS